jgi:hypothetical protein
MDSIRSGYLLEENLILRLSICAFMFYKMNNLPQPAIDSGTHIDPYSTPAGQVRTKEQLIAHCNRQQQGDHRTPLFRVYSAIAGLISWGVRKVLALRKQPAVILTPRSSTSPYVCFANPLGTPSTPYRMQYPSQIHLEGFKASPPVIQVTIFFVD